MKKNKNQGWMVGLIVWLLTITCGLPTAATQVTQSPGEPTLSPQDVASTAASIAMTAQAGDTDEPTAQFVPSPTTQPTATQCVAMVTTNTNANVRIGPDTAYDIIGAIPLGGTARVAGQNQAKTWWYIEFAGGPGGYAWIAGSVTTATCIPSALQIVAAPPLPTAIPATATTVPPVVAKPDLYVSEYSWSPMPPHMGVSFHVRVGVYNQGNAAAGAFTVQWWLTTTGSGPTCTWNKPSLVAHGGWVLECDYTPGGWNNAYPSRVVVDPLDYVDESNESNNTWSAPLQIAP